LFLIGRTSTRLCIDALKAAVAEAKKGKDIERYEKAVEHLYMACPTDPDAVIDRQWTNRTEQANRAETHRLEAELKGYKNNLIKESIRVRIRPEKANLAVRHDLANPSTWTDGPRRPRQAL
jgi:COP9 signalosome complex subunit 1